MQCLTKTPHFFSARRLLFSNVFKGKKRDMDVICISRTEFMIISCGLRRKFMVENRCECTHPMNVCIHYSIGCHTCAQFVFFPYRFFCLNWFLLTWCEENNQWFICANTAWGSTTYAKCSVQWKIDFFDVHLDCWSRKNDESMGLYAWSYANCVSNKKGMVSLFLTLSLFLFYYLILLMYYVRCCVQHAAG